MSWFSIFSVTDPTSINPDIVTMIPWYIVSVLVVIILMQKWKLSKIHKELDRSVGSKSIVRSHSINHRTNSKTQELQKEIQFWQNYSQELESEKSCMTDRIKELEYKIEYQQQQIKSPDQKLQQQFQEFQDKYKSLENQRDRLENRVSELEEEQDYLILDFREMYWSQKSDSKEKTKEISEIQELKNEIYLNDSEFYNFQMSRLDCQELNEQLKKLQKDYDILEAERERTNPQGQSLKLSQFERQELQQQFRQFYKSYTTLERKQRVLNTKVQKLRAKIRELESDQAQQKNLQQNAQTLGTEYQKIQKIQTIVQQLEVDDRNTNDCRLPIFLYELFSVEPMSKIEREELQRQFEKFQEDYNFLKSEYELNLVIISSEN